MNRPLSGRGVLGSLAAACAHITFAAWCVAAEPPTPEMIRKSLMELAEQGQRDESSEPFKYSITRRVFAKLNEQELEELRRQITGKPDHPRLSEYQAEARRHRMGPDITEYVLFWADKELYRANESSPGREQAYLDVARDGASIWQLVPIQLTLLDARRGSVGGYMPESVATSLRREVDVGLSAELATFVQARFEVGPVEVASDGWTAILVRDKLSVSYSGTWEATSGSVLVSEWAARNSADGKGEYRRRVRERRFDTLLGHNVVAVCERMDKDGRVLSVSEFGPAERVTRDEVRSLAQPPDPTGRDPIRGDLRVANTVDLRSEAGVDRAAAQPGAGVESPRTKTFRFTGWALLGAAGVAVVLRASARWRRSAMEP